MGNNSQSEQQTRDREEEEEKRSSANCAASTKGKHVGSEGEGGANVDEVVPEQQYSKPALAALGVDAPSSVAAVVVGTKHVRVRAFMGNQTRTILRFPMRCWLTRGQAADTTPLRYSYPSSNPPEEGGNR